MYYNNKKIYVIIRLIVYQSYSVNGGLITMNRIVEELKNVGTFYIATIENDQPRVRPFSSVTEFEGNTYLCTRKSKRNI